MGKYKNIIIILIITVCINLLSSLDIGLLLIIILDSLGIITIIILAKSTNTYEEKIIDSISKLIYKILNISTILIIISSLCINIIQYKNITNTYCKISEKDVFKFNTVAIKNIAVDILSTKDVFNYIIKDKDKKQEIEEKYKDINSKTVFTEFLNIKNVFNDVDLFRIISSSYWLTSHYRKTRNLCIITVLSYISLLYWLCKSKHKTR